MANEEPIKTYSDGPYWSNRWEINEIQFHKNDLHPFLVKHLHELTLNRENLTFFFPLCGKAVDMAWLASKGHQIVGVELVQKAVEEFFQEQNIKYNLKEIGDFKLYSSDDGKIRLYQGDFFKFNKDFEAVLDCVWDRGSLVALPAELREKYVPHILEILEGKNFRYLLDTYSYDPHFYPGPPHLVTLEEIKRLYGDGINIKHLETADHRSFSNNPDTPDKEIIYLLLKAN